MPPRRPIPPVYGSNPNVCPNAHARRAAFYHKRNVAACGCGGFFRIENNPALCKQFFCCIYKPRSVRGRTAHAAADSSALFKAGQAAGNTSSGRTDGKPNAHVQGRSTVGNIPRPVYNVQESGIVVVNIVVDNYGNVVRAVPGGDGTTVLDKTLYAAARNAAMDTHFNMSADAPAMQEGTITYYFNLK